MKQTIIFIFGFYPYGNDERQCFVRPVVHGIADKGIKCIVFSPQSITNNLIRRYQFRKTFWFDRTKNGNKIEVYQPYTLTFSGYFKKLTTLIDNYNLKRLYEKVRTTPFCFYAHFWRNGIRANRLVNKLKLRVPVYVACGESTINIDRMINFNSVEGVIFVSKKNYIESQQKGLYNESMKSIVLPNGVDKDIFFKRNKIKVREKLGLPLNEIIAIYVGSFSERKGVERLVNAAKLIPELKLICIGKGKIKEKSKQIIFSGEVSHEEVPLYLNAADFFVLPTLAEGCCNAIIEAMACGLPIISSNLSFNDDILTKENSIRINPSNISEIAEAMKYMMLNKKMQEKMSSESLNIASQFEIDKRVDRILKFIGIE